MHARLKSEFMEDEKYHNLMTWLILLLREDFGSMTDKQHGIKYIHVIPPSSSGSSLK